MDPRCGLYPDTSSIQANTSLMPTVIKNAATAKTMNKITSNLLLNILYPRLGARRPPLGSQAWFSGIGSCFADGGGCRLPAMDCK